MNDRFWLEVDKVINDDGNSSLQLNTCHVKRNISEIYNETIENTKSKKMKKKHDESLCSQNYAINNREDEKIIERNEIGAIQSTNGYISNNCSNKKKKSKKNELLDTLLYENSSINNENIKSKKNKKKRKHSTILYPQDSVTTCSKDEKMVIKNNVIGSVESLNNYAFNNLITKTNKHQNQELLDDSSGINNENVESKKTKKKKKKKSLHSQDFTTTCSSDENMGKKNVAESIEIINNHASNDFVTKEKELLDTLLDDSRGINDKNVESKKTKKKEKKKSLHSQDFITTYSTDENMVKINVAESIEITNNHASSDFMTKEKELLDTLLDDSRGINDKNVESKKTKKKKKNKSLHSQDFITTYSTDENMVKINVAESIEITNNHASNDFMTKEKELLDTLLDDSRGINDKNVESMKTKKKKKKKSLHSQDFITTYSTDENMVKINVAESIEITNNHASNDFMTKEKELLDTLLDDSRGINDKNVESKKTKKNENYTKCTLDFTTISTTEETISKRKRQSSESSLDSFIAEPVIKKKNKNTRKKKIIKVSSNQIVKEGKSLVKNIKLLQKNLTESEEINNHQNANDFCDDDCNYIIEITDDANSNKNNHSVSQENPDLETLLDTIEKYRNENLSTNAESIQLNIPNLINEIISTNKSIKSHPNFTLILKKLTMELNKLLIKGQIKVVNLDIILLKIIGEKILEKLIERQNSIESVQNLSIKNVSSESKKNDVHQVETNLTKYPSKSQMTLIKKLRPSIKLGTFNEDEDNIIKKYWSKFQKEYNILDVRPFLSDFLEMALPSSERLNFARYISAGLPDRLLFSVYTRFNSLFNKRLDKLNFKKEEDDLIMQVINCDAIKNKYAVLCLLLKRNKFQLVRRYNSLKLEPLRKQRIIWDNDKRQLLLESILLETNTQNWKNLKNITIKKEEWIKIAEHFDEPIGYDKVRTQWKFLSTMLFCKTRITQSTLKLAVLQLLLEINPKYWSDLNWIEITNKLFPGADSKVITTIFHWWVTKKVPSELRSNVKDVLKYLSSQVEPIADKIECNKDTYFTRLTVNNDNKLVEIDDDEES